MCALYCCHEPRRSISSTCCQPVVLFILYIAVSMLAPLHVLAEHILFGSCVCVPFWTLGCSGLLCIRGTWNFFEPSTQKCVVITYSTSTSRTSGFTGHRLSVIVSPKGQQARSSCQASRVTRCRCGVGTDNCWGEKLSCMNNDR